jgi:hypothetical protein
MCTSPGFNCSISGGCTSPALDCTTPFDENIDEYYEWATEDEAYDEKKAIEICRLLLCLLVISILLYVAMK